MTAPEKHGLKFYGRRKGKALRKTKVEAYEEVLPEIEIKLTDNPLFPLSRPAGEGTRQAPPPPSENKIDPASFFPFPVSELRMEIGFGDGEHLLHQALQNPNAGFIGCEPFLNGIAALCVGIQKHDVKNIRIFPDDARLLMSKLADRCIDVCYILNSDPWPKTRHHKRRFIQKETLDELHRLLKPGAEFRMSSDHPGLAAWQLEKTYFHGGFDWTAQCAADWRDRPADMPETRYQRKNMAGHPMTFTNFRRV